MGLMILLIFLLAAVFVFSYVAGIYNRLIEIRNNVDKSWGNREFYNDSVNIYNIRISQIPCVFLANSMGWRSCEMFKAAVDEKCPPDINFSL